VYLTVKNPDADISINFEVNEQPTQHHFKLISDVLQKLGLAVPDFLDLDGEEAHYEAQNRQNAQQALDSPATWATMVVDVIQIIEPDARDAALKALAEELNRRGTGPSSKIRLEGGKWADDAERKARLYDELVEVERLAAQRDQVAHPEHECVYIGKPAMCGQCGAPEPVEGSASEDRLGNPTHDRIGKPGWN
jgi:hypothetical protein